MITEQAVFDALPPGSFIEKYVRYASSMTESHASFHVIGALSILTQIVPSEYHIPFSAKIYSNMYGLTIAGSTAGKKSTAVKIAKSILQEVVTGHVMEQPGSDEGFVEQIRKTPHAILIYEEFGDFLMKAQEGYFQRLKGTLLSVYDGSPVGRALAKAQRGSVDNPRFSLLGAVATDILDTHTTDDDWTSGFLARFFCAYGLPERKFKRQPLENPQARAEVVACLKARLPPLKPLGQCHWLDESAEALWDRWYDYRDGWAAKAPKELKPAYQRAEGFLQKICLLLAWDLGMARNGAPWAVTEEILAYAVQIVDIHFHSLAELAHRMAVGKDMRARRSVLDAIMPDRPTSLGEITRGARVLKNRSLTDILDTLQEEGCIQRVIVNGKSYFQKTNPDGLALLNAHSDNIEGEPTNG